VKIVLDTNVLISGIFFSGPPHLILRAWREGRVDLALSREIFEEYSQTASILAENFPPVDLHSVLALIEKEAEFYEVQPLPRQVCSDPEDDKFLACALASHAEGIVSGDKHLLKVSGFQGILVLRPRAFMEAYLSGRALCDYNSETQSPAK
jgi:putative PIN family toxin of toxin-antitoxin system